MSEKIVIADEKKITDVIFNQLHTCDGDALAHVVEILTGIPCSAIDGGYTFFIDEHNQEDFNTLFK